MNTIATRQRSTIARAIPQAMSKFCSCLTTPQRIRMAHRLPKETPRALDMLRRMPFTFSLRAVIGAQARNRARVTV
jgi:hypothetical protein